MIEFKPFQDHYILFDIEEHNFIKEEIIENIFHSSGSLINEHENYIVNRQDYENSFDFTRNYVKIFLPVIKKYLNKVFFEYMYNPKYTITNIWYHSYAKNDNYGWHIHDSVNWVGIYYLKLSKNSPKTDIKSLVKKNKVYTPNVKEGSVLVFPAHLHHRSNYLHTNDQKISIVFNIINK